MRVGETTNDGLLGVITIAVYFTLIVCVCMCVCARTHTRVHVHMSVWEGGPMSVWVGRYTLI